MLLAFIAVFLAINLIVGIVSIRFVKTSNDFILAGRRLPLSVATFTVFATWFGSETLFGASAAFIDGGFLAVIEDPFGGMLCLVLVGSLFAKRLYKMNYLTLADLFRDKYGQQVELISSIAIIISYFSWIAAQMVALGLAINLVANIPMNWAVIIASCIVIAYTFAGGMWSVSITDFIQTGFIIIGLIIVAWIIIPKAGGVQQMIQQAPEGFFRIIPHKGTTSIGWLEYIAAWITLGLGSIPAQDVYQRVMSAKSEKVAANASIIAGLMYITIGMIPLFLALAATRILTVSPDDKQMLLSILVLQHTPFPVQVLFFGAVIAAIMSTASGATLAPATVLSENIIRRYIRKPKNDYEFLWINRFSVLIISFVALLMATTRNNIYELVGEAASIGLVSLFIPMVIALFTPWTNKWAAAASIIGGLGAWIWTYFIHPTTIPAIFYGLGTSLLLYIIVGYFALPRKLQNNQTQN